MDAAAIQAKINRGAAIAAQKLGETCTWYRPLDALRCVVSEAVMGTILCYFDPSFQFTAKAPNLYGKPVYGALLDRTKTLPGDYLSAPSGVYFIAGQQPLLPTIAVQCNALVNITRPAGAIPLTPGINAYSAETAATDQPLMTGWPASLLQGGRTQTSRADLPGEVQNKGFTGLLPYWPGVIFRTADRVSDTTTGKMLTISAAELTDLGWRLDLVLTVP
jgi:hypothetical protein